MLNTTTQRSRTLQITMITSFTIAMTTQILRHFCSLAPPTPSWQQQQQQHAAVATPQKPPREETRQFGFEDSMPSFSALFPDDSSRAFVLDNLSLLYSPSAALTNHSVLSAKGQRKSQPKSQPPTRRNLTVSSPFKESVRNQSTDISASEAAAPVKIATPVGKENDIKSPFAAIIAMHNASPKDVDSKLMFPAHIQKYKSPTNDTSRSSVHSAGSN